jgi:hypothetical protein
MNRSQRRAAAESKHKRRAAPEQWEAPPNEGQKKPSLILRLFANVALAPWVLKRVTHPGVERVLADVAIQAGRPEAAAYLLNRIALREKGSR